MQRASVDLSMEHLHMEAEDLSLFPSFLADNMVFNFKTNSIFRWLWKCKTVNEITKAAAVSLEVSYSLFSVFGICVSLTRLCGFENESVLGGQWK